MAGDAGEGAIAGGLKRRICQLHDGFVGDVKTAFGAQRLDLGVGDVAACRLQQALNGYRVRLDFFRGIGQPGYPSSCGSPTMNSLGPASTFIMKASLLFFNLCHSLWLYTFGLISR